MRPFNRQREEVFSKLMKIFAREEGKIALDQKFYSMKCTVSHSLIPKSMIQSLLTFLEKRVWERTSVENKINMQALENINIMKNYPNKFKFQIFYSTTWVVSKYILLFESFFIGNYLPPNGFKITTSPFNLLLQREEMQF